MKKILRGKEQGGKEGLINVVIMIIMIIMIISEVRGKIILTNISLC